MDKQTFNELAIKVPLSQYGILHTEGDCIYIDGDWERPDYEMTAVEPWIDTLVFERFRYGRSEPGVWWRCKLGLVPMAWAVFARIFTQVRQGGKLNGEFYMRKKGPYYTVDICEYPTKSTAH